MSLSFLSPILPLSFYHLLNYIIDNEPSCYKILVKLNYSFMFKKKS